MDREARLSAATAPNLPREVVEKLSGRVIQEMRARGLLAGKGLLDITEFINRFLSADVLVCILTDSCDQLYKTIDCTLHPNKAGVWNAVEIANGRIPFNADTDGDGHPDGVDAYPLDSTRWQAGPPDPNDHTPPIITLAEPPAATLISTVP